MGTIYVTFCGLKPATAEDIFCCVLSSASAVVAGTLALAVALHRNVGLTSWKIRQANAT